MSVVFIALPFALLLALLFLAAFVWSVRSGQMDDLETPALRIFSEEDEITPPNNEDEDDTSKPAS